MLLIRPWTIGPCCAGGAVSFYATKIHVEQSSYGFFNRLGRATLWQRLNGSVILEQKDKSVPLPVVMEDEATKMNVEPPSRKPKMAMIDWTSRILMRSFLPQGYPQTVHPFYTLFCSWWFAQNVVGSVLGALSTQALLIAMGLSSPAVLSSAVALQWVIKDALGQFGGIVTAGILGGRFDIQAKQLRFMSIAIMYFASLLEIVTLTMPGYFLLFASFANLAKNISWIITSATRASLLSQFTKIGQLGDLTAKSASQGTAAGLIGTGIGIVLSNYYALGSFQSFLAAYIPLTCLGLFSLYKSATYILTNSLTRERLDMLHEHCQATWLSDSHFSLLSPEQVSLKESFLPFTLSRGPKSPAVRINASLQDPVVYRQFQLAAQYRHAKDRHVFYVDKDTTSCYLWLLDSATTEDCLRAYFNVWRHVASSCQEGGLGGPFLTDFECWKGAMIAKGWNLNSLYFPEMERRRVRFVKQLGPE